MARLRILSWVVVALVASNCSTSRISIRSPASPISVEGPTIYVPVRWCVVEGSPPTQPSTNTDAALVSYLAQADRIWTPQSGISFYPAVTAQGSHYESIADPTTALGLSGDVQILGDDLFQDPEAMQVREECLARWQSEPQALGLIVVDIGYFLARSGARDPTLGITSPTPAALLESPMRYCGEPRAILPSDVADGFSLVMDESERNFGNPVTGLAHELGHLLLLKHGDGLDNDGDGVYDSFCDPFEQDTGTSLMTLEAPTTTVITSLQASTARDAARAAPGAAACVTCKPFHPPIQ